MDTGPTSISLYSPSPLPSSSVPSQCLSVCSSGLASLFFCWFPLKQLLPLSFLVCVTSTLSDPPPPTFSVSLSLLSFPSPVSTAPSSQPPDSASGSGPHSLPGMIWSWWVGGWREGGLTPASHLRNQVSWGGVLSTKEREGGMDGWQRCPGTGAGCLPLLGDPRC